MSLKYIKTIKDDGFEDLDIIIPAAGMGKRMKSYGPKPLIKIKKEKTILDFQLDILKTKFPNSNIILVSGFQSVNLMQNSPSSLIKIENESYENNNVARSIGIGLRATHKGKVLVVYGDLVFNKKCLDCLDYNHSCILASNEIMKKNEIGCIVNPKNFFLENMMYDLELKWGQISLFTGHELKILKEVCWNPQNYNLFGFEAINKIMQYGGKFKVRTEKGLKVVDVDSSKDLELVRGII